MLIVEMAFGNKFTSISKRHMTVIYPFFLFCLSLFYQTFSIFLMTLIFAYPFLLYHHLLHYNFIIFYCILSLFNIIIFYILLRSTNKSTSFNKSFCQGKLFYQKTGVNLKLLDNQICMTIDHHSIHQYPCGKYKGIK